MSQKEFVLARKFSSISALTEGMCSELNLDKEYDLRPIPDFKFSFPENARELLVVELVSRAQHPESGEDFLPSGVYESSEKLTSIIVLVRQGSDTLAFWLESGFKVAGAINSRAPLIERSLKAAFPVEALVDGVVPPAVVIGRANVNLLAQVRALGECGISIYCILTRDENPIIAKSSRYVRQVFDCRNRSDDCVIESIKAISRLSAAKPVVYTAGDLDIGLLARIWMDIEDLVLAPNDPELSNELNNKAVQMEKMMAAGINVPLSQLLQDEADLQSAIRHFSFPTICKPTELAKKGAFIGKTFIAENDSELRRRLGPLMASGGASVLIQEYIPGSEDSIFFALAACSSGGNVCSKITGRKLLDDGRGCIGLGETVYNHQLTIESEKALRGFSAGGVIGVEFKRHDATGDFYFIEANFRPENTHAISKAAGVNLSLITYLEAIGKGEVYDPLPCRKVTWMDASLVILSKFRSHSEKASSRSRQQTRSKAGQGKVTDALWVLADPLPALIWYLLKSVSFGRRSFNILLSRFG